MAKEPKFTRGQTVWTYDPNRRVYPEPRPGEPRDWTAGPIVRESFVRHIVLEVRPQSYVIQRWYAVRPGEPFVVGREKAERAFYSDAEREQRVWVEDLRPALADAVRSITDPGLLRKVAALVGYDPGERDVR